MKNLLKDPVIMTNHLNTALDDFPSIKKYMQEKIKELDAVFLHLKSHTYPVSSPYDYWFDLAETYLEYDDEQEWTTEAYEEMENNRIKENRKKLDKLNTFLALKGY